MHELAIAEQVIASVLERIGERRVTVVRLRVGKLSAVVPDALMFCFELAAAGTTLEGAALEVEEEPGRALCRTCGEQFLLRDLILLCVCGSADVEVLTGRELQVTSVEVT